MERPSKLRFFLAMILVTAFTVVYARHWRLPDRYDNHREREQSIRNLEREVVNLQAMLEEEQQRLEGLSQDPLEIEASIRYWNQFVRDGEIVFRIEERPLDHQE